MRFHVGPIPENTTFHPEQDGWQPLKEPTIWMAQLLAVPVAMVAFFVVMLAWWILTPSELQARTRAAVRLFALPAFLIILPIHEYVHARFHPLGGESPATLYGFWPSKLALYAHYDDEVSRNRYLTILIAPFVALTIVPLVICAAFSVAPPVVIALTTMNCLGAALDLFGVGLIGLQLPASAILRNKGYRTWWKPAT
jgi:hypothetical protein